MRQSPSDHTPENSNGHFRVGEWRISPDLNRVESPEGQEQQVEPRVMVALVHLAHRANQVVSRAELFEAVWGETVVNEESLTRVIWELRTLFGDDPKSPRYIETIRKGGYRLVAPVLFLPAAAETTVDARRKGRSPWPWLIGVAAIAVIAGLYWMKGTPPEELPIPTTIQGVPLTSYPGRETKPAFSPDGTQIAFAWNRDDGNFDIYVKQLNTETPLQLTDHQANESNPAWSPDGSTIAFSRSGEKESIWTVPSIGGAPRRLVETNTGILALDWSPDGKWLLYTSWVEEDRPPQITQLNVETLERRVITLPTARFSCDYFPRISPDGRQIAFVRSGPISWQSIFTVSIEGGEPKRITSTQERLAGLDWSADGRSIIYSASSSVNYDLWRVSVESGEATWLPTRGNSSLYPTLSTDGQRLVYEERSRELNIWRLLIDDKGEASVDTEPFIASSRFDMSAHFSPDGDRISFLSTRSGSKQLWICDRDGRNPRKLTHFEDVFLEGHAWSADGKTIALSVVESKKALTYVVESESGVATRLTGESCNEVTPIWSRDGKSIYYERGDGDDWRIWKKEVNGSEHEPVVAMAATPILESAEGDLYYYNVEDGGFWKETAGGGEEMVIDPEAMVYWSAVHIVPEGAYFALMRGPQETLIGFQDFQGGEARLVARIPVSGVAGLAVSPDRTEILFDRASEVESDLILVEGLN